MADHRLGIKGTGSKHFDCSAERMQDRHRPDHRHLIVVDAEGREPGLCLVGRNTELLEGAAAAYPGQAVLNRLHGACAIDHGVPATCSDEFVCIGPDQFDTHIMRCLPALWIGVDDADDAAPARGASWAMINPMVPAP